MEALAAEKRLVAINIARFPGIIVGQAQGTITQGRRRELGHVGSAWGGCGGPRRQTSIVGRVGECFDERGLSTHADDRRQAKQTGGKSGGFCRGPNPRKEKSGDQGIAPGKTMIGAGGMGQ